MRALTVTEARAYATAAACALTAACALVRAHRLAVKVGSLSQPEIDNLIAASSADLAVMECASEDHAHTRGWVVQHEAPATDAGKFFWWVGAAGGSDPRYAMRPLRTASGWARSIKAAVHDRDAAVEKLLDPEPTDAGT